MNILKIIFRVSFSFSVSLILMGTRCGMVVAQIVPDNSLGSKTSKLNSPIGEALVIQGGLAQGKNLFHSFSEFNVNPGQKVYFQGLAGVDHTVARVTGNKISNIAGSLGSGSSNLYLVNPNGFFFSGEVNLSISGKFVAATDRNSALFKDIPSFDHSEYSQAVLMNVPVGIQSGNIKREYLGDISAAAESKGVITTYGDFILAARNIDLSNSNIRTGILIADGRSEIPPNIIISASKNLKVKDINATGSQILLLSGGSIDTTSGSIGIFTQDPRLDQLLSLNRSPLFDVDAQVLSNTSIFVRARGDAKIGNMTACCIQIRSEKGGIDTTKGYIHALTSSTHSAELLDFASSADAEFLESKYGQKKYGDFVSFIELSAARDIRVNIIEANGNVSESGPIVVAPPTPTVQPFFGGQALGSSSSNIDILEGNDSSVSTPVTFDNSYASALQASIVKFSTQRSLFVGELRDRTHFVIPTGTVVDGIMLTEDMQELVLAPVLLVTPIPRSISDISRETLDKEIFNAKSGDIYLKASNIEIVEGGRISSNSGYRLKPGSIFLESSNKIYIDGRTKGSNLPSGIFSRINGDPDSWIEKYGRNYGSGYGSSYSGLIAIKASDLVLDNSAEISVSSASKVTGSPDDRLGINVEVNNLHLLGSSKIEASTLLYSNAKNINLIVNKNLTISGTGAGIFATSNSTGSAGGIKIAPSGDSNDLKIKLTNGAAITSKSVRSRAGNIGIKSGNLSLDKSSISSEANRSFGGNLDLVINNVLLMRNKSSISSSSGSNNPSSSGGNISIASAFLVAPPFENNDIKANGFDGKGGEVTINTQKTFGFTPRSRSDLTRLLKSTDPNALDPIKLQTSDITAISQNNPTLNGSVALAELNVDPAKGLDGEPLVPSAPSVSEDCSIQPQSQGSRIINSGQGGITPMPADSLVPSNIWQEASTKTIQGISPPEIILPIAQGWSRKDDQTVVLTGQTTPKPTAVACHTS
jgi:filamentous hemagglutinin family protein